MEILDLKLKPKFSSDKKYEVAFHKMDGLLVALRKKAIPEDIVKLINNEVEEVNLSAFEGKQLRRLIRKKKTNIIILVENQLNFVPINHYRNRYLAIGMTVFGIPMGIAFGTVFHNMGFLGIGLPIGMAVGIAIGTSKDKEALNLGRQLDIEIS